MHDHVRQDQARVQGTEHAHKAGPRSQRAHEKPMEAVCAPAAQAKGTSATTQYARSRLQLHAVRISKSSEQRQVWRIAEVHAVCTQPLSSQVSGLMLKLSKSQLRQKVEGSPSCVPPHYVVRTQGSRLCALLLPLEAMTMCGHMCCPAQASY